MGPASQALLAATPRGLKKHGHGLQMILQSLASIAAGPVSQNTVEAIIAKSLRCKTQRVSQIGGLHMSTKACVRGIHAHVW